MISIRSFGRSAPRTLSRLTTSAIRRPAARPSLLLKAAWKPGRTQYSSAFSTSSIRSSTAGEGDAELVAKLESEIALEASMVEDENIPTSVKDYLENGPFKITDKPGQEEVVLTRTFGDEKIQITFSIADLNALDPEAEYQDRAMADEEEGINQGDGTQFKAAPENSIEEEGDGDESGGSFPARLNIIIEKPAKGALAVESVVQDGMVVIDNVYFYKDAAHAYAKSAEKVHERHDLYGGPPFGNLDEDLQVLLERYLDERGINTALAIFVPDYIDVKEQREYSRWLTNVKEFVES